MRLDHLRASRTRRAYGLESVTLEYRDMYYRKGPRVHTTATLQTHFSFRYSSACFRFHFARQHVSCLRMSDRQARGGRTVSCTHLNTPSQVSTRDAFCTTFVLPRTTADDKHWLGSHGTARIGSKVLGQVSIRLSSWREVDMSLYRKLCMCRRRRSEPSST